MAAFLTVLVIVLAVVVGIVTLVVLAIVKPRFDKIERRLDASKDLDDAAAGSRAQMAKLADRVARLEAAVLVQPPTVPTPPQPAPRSPLQPAVSLPVVAAPPQPVSSSPVRSSVIPRVVVAPAPPAPPAVKEAPKSIAPPPVRPAPAPIPVQPKPEPLVERAVQMPSHTRPSLMSRLGRRVREELEREEWEAVVGGSWLNKLGVVVLVIGIALFLGYSLTQLGPAGRVGVGLAARVTLLAAGVGFERKPRYRIFGRGLIGGGWAGLYFTTYAMHALEAARVVANPLVASVALVLVAAGMIVQSLRYRSQVVTGLAYFIGFSTLAITPVTAFSLVATVPLAASLLVVAQRFAWAPMAVVGLVTTYGTYLITGAGAPAASLQQFARESIVLAVSWLLFEGFDLFYRRGGRGIGSDRFLFPLNACGFVGVSLLRWSTFTPEMLYVFFGIATAAYLMSAVARALVRRAAASSVEADPLSAFTRSHCASVTLAVALVTPALFLRFSGMQLNIAFLVVAELLFLSALRFGDSYLRWLAGLVLAVPVLKSAIVDPRLTGELLVGTWTWLRWTPTAAVTAAVLYMNRALLGRRDPILPELGYRALASALLALIVGFETPPQYGGAAWFVLGLALFEIGLRKGLEEFRSHAYLIGAVALSVMAGRNVAGIQKGSWFAPAIDAALAYAAAARLELPLRRTLSKLECQHLWRVCSWSGSVFLTALIWAITPAALVGFAWLILALLLFESGLRPRFSVFLPQAYAVGALAFAMVAMVNVPNVGAAWQPLALATLATAVAVVR
jgi:hypothetical protein